MSTHNHRLLLQELMCLNESELQLYLDSIHYKIQDKDTRPSFEVLFTLFSYIESKVFRMIKNKKDLNTIVLWGNMANFLMKEVPVLYDRKPYWRDGDFTQSVKFRGKSIRALNHLDSSFLDFNILIDDVV